MRAAAVLLNTITPHIGSYCTLSDFVAHTGCSSLLLHSLHCIFLSLFLSRFSLGMGFTLTCCSFSLSLGSWEDYSAHTPLRSAFWVLFLFLWDCTTTLPLVHLSSLLGLWSLSPLSWNSLTASHFLCLGYKFHTADFWEVHLGLWEEDFSHGTLISLEFSLSHLLLLPCTAFIYTVCLLTSLMRDDYVLLSFSTFFIYLRFLLDSVLHILLHSFYGLSLSFFSIYHSFLYSQFYFSFSPITINSYIVFTHSFFSFLFLSGLVLTTSIVSLSLSSLLVLVHYTSFFFFFFFGSHYHGSHSI